MEHPAFFAIDGDGRYVPTARARSLWSDTMVTGPAVVAALARAAEVDHGADGFVPVRFTVDLFAPVPFEPLTVETRAVRTGNRIRVADAWLLQDGETVARASLIQLRRGEPAPGRSWQPERVLPVPEQVADAPLSPGERGFFGSGGGAVSWSHDKSDHQNAGRKRLWLRPLDVVVGESATPFQRAATLGESTSFMAHWGDAGMAYINADLTIALARLPRTDDFGVEADTHINAEGVAVGSATLYDRDGVFGTGTVVALANARRLIDFSDPALSASGIGATSVGAEAI